MSPTSGWPSMQARMARAMSSPYQSGTTARLILLMARGPAATSTKMRVVRL